MDNEVRRYLKWLRSEKNARLYGGTINAKQAMMLLDRDVLAWNKKNPNETMTKEEFCKQANFSINA